MTPANAEQTAIEALAFLADDPERIAAFMTASGITPGAIRQHAHDATFLGSVLDFVMADDALARAFCASAGCAAEKLHRARAVLPGGAAPDWT